MSDIDEPTPNESRALSFLRALAAARDHSTHVLDYVYDHRHLRRVKKALREEGIRTRFGAHERGVWVYVIVKLTRRAKPPIAPGS